MDQIIIEIMGDPSGLKPAEDALKGLAKISQGTMEAFNKANEAAARLATSAAAAGDGINQNITAISRLTQAISGGVVKAATQDFAALTRKIREQHVVSLDNAAAEKKLSDEVTAYKIANAKKQADAEKQLGAEAIKIAQQVSDAIFVSQQQRRTNELKATEENLEAQKNAELLNTTLTASQRIAIARKFKNEEAQAKLQAWKADQKAKEEQAIINGLLAFTMSLAQQGYPAGLVTGLLAIASAGVQAGIIASKTPPKFAKGTKGIATLPAGMKLVGEEGPEIIYTPGGEKVFTAPDTEKILAGYNVPTLPIPMLSTLPRLNEISKIAEAVKVSPPWRGDLEGAIGRAIAAHIPAPVVNSIQLNEKGFIKYLRKRGNTTEYLNNEIKF